MRRVSRAARPRRRRRNLRTNETSDGGREAAVFVHAGHIAAELFDMRSGWSRTQPTDFQRLAGRAFAERRFHSPPPRREELEDVEFFVRETAEDAVARTTTELTGWELVVFELADEEESGE